MAGRKSTPSFIDRYGSPAAGNARIGAAQKGGSPSSRRTLLAIAAATPAAGVALALLWNSGVGGGGDNASCAERVIIVDPSASLRDESLGLARDAIVAAGESAAVCGRSVFAAAVVPGHTVTLLSSDDVAVLAPDGPNARVRERRFSDAARQKIAELVAERMGEALTMLPADRSDVAGLLAAAADRSNPETRVLIVTDAVHRDDAIDLDRPLVPGDGARLGDELQIGPVAAARLSFVGVGQVDSIAAPPSNVWVDELREFAATVCARSGATDCRVMGAATVGEVL